MHLRASTYRLMCFSIIKTINIMDGPGAAVNCCDIYLDLRVWATLNC